MKSLSSKVLALTLIVPILLMSACGKSEPTPSIESEANLEVVIAEHSAVPPGLPKMEACQDTNRPVLPNKWTASALMQTFGEHDVVLGKFTFDNEEQAYRFSMSRPGSSAFTDYLLTADHRLYALQGPYDQPTSCRYSLMLEMGLPAIDTMSKSAQCIGEAEINGENRQWWKDNAEQVPGANWYWFNTDADRNLFRTMPYKGVNNLGIAGKYAFTYYSDFSPQSSTNIGALKQLCGINNLDESLPAGNAIELADAIDQLLPPVEDVSSDGAAPEVSAAPFYPGVEQCNSPGQQPPPWPNTVQATTFLTAVNVAYSPFPSLVRYNAGEQGLRTDMYNPWPSKDKKWDLYSARLHNNTGYSAYATNDNYQSCEQDLPGPPVANWMAIDGCECKAALPANSALNPRDETLLVMMCPLTPQSTSPDNPQVFWTWYGEQSGSPQVFMQSDSSATAGTGLNLADYYSWQPNVSVDPAIFTPPPICAGQPKQQVPPQCHNCHLPTNSEFQSGETAEWHIPIH